jgi:hypothetical protein
MTAAQICMPISRARSCSSFSRFSSGEGGAAQKRFSALAAGKTREAVQRLTAIAIDADMTPDGGVAVQGRAREIEGARLTFAFAQGQHRLDHVGIGPVRPVGLGGDQGGDVAGRLAVQNGGAGDGQTGAGEGHVALDVDDGVEIALGVDGVHGGANAVRARRQGGVRQDGVAACGFHRLDDLGIASGDHDRQARGLGLTIGAHDHRRVADQGQRLVRQAGGGHASRYHYQRIHRLP